MQILTNEKNSKSTTSSLSLSICFHSLCVQMREALVMIRQSTIMEVLEAIETLMVYTSNLIKSPHEKKYRKIKRTNTHFHERLGHCPGATEAMSAIGYVGVGEFLKLDERRVEHPTNEKTLNDVYALLQSALEETKVEWNLLPTRTTLTHSFSSVKAAGSHSAIGKRHHMEDDEIVVDKFCGDEKQGYFGLYDGHGGRATVDFVVKALHVVSHM